MNKQFNFVHKYIMPMFVVFCSTAHGMEIETVDSQKTINSPSGTVNPNNASKDLKAILEEKEATEIENLFKSAVCEMYWINVRFSSHNAEIIEDTRWRIRRESPVGLSGGELFIRFLNEFLTLNATHPIITQEETKRLLTECCTSEDKCDTLEDLEDRESFIIKCCNIVIALRHYLKSH